MGDPGGCGRKVPIGVLVGPKAGGRAGPWVARCGREVSRRGVLSPVSAGACWG